MKRCIIMILLALTMSITLAACGMIGEVADTGEELSVSSSTCKSTNGKMTVSLNWLPEEGMTGTFDDSYELLFNREDAFNYGPYGTYEPENAQTYELNPDGETTFEINLKDDVGMMDVGYYCLVKKFHIVTADGEELEQEYRIEFQN